MSLRFLSELGEDVVGGILWAVVAGDGDELVSVDVDASVDPWILYVTMTAPLDLGDGVERCELCDWYEIDDFDVRPFDWAGGADVTSRWRRSMYERFGAEYAEAYLFGELGTGV